MTSRDSLSFDIYGITTCTEKHEAAGFEFRNRCRPIDGFVLFTDGEAELDIVGEEKLCVKKGDFIIFNQGDSYRFYAEKPCSYITCGFMLDFKSGNKTKALPRMSKCTDEQFSRIDLLAKEWGVSRYDSEMSCRIGIMAFYLDLFRATANKELSDTDPAIKLAIDFLHGNFKRNFKTEEIAKFCSLSPSYLRSRFSEKMGMTLTEYRDRLRIKAARELLSGGEFSIKETAMELGFCDVYHFSKFFTRYAYTTPARFAKEKRHQG